MTSHPERWTDTVPNPPLWPLLLAFLAALGLIAGGVTALVIGASAPDPADTSMATKPAIVRIAELPTETVAVYRYAAEQRSNFADLPCYCGCDRTLGHRNLYDCFVTADGDWDAHASGCAVCSAEANTARRELQAGSSATEVRAGLVALYGPPPATFARSTSP